jgi:hypothetical protein
VDAYLLARSGDFKAQDEFEARYACVRASCANIEELRFHKNPTLRFVKDDFGWFLVATRGASSHLALPWFTSNLAVDRQSFRGVFHYPEAAADVKLRVARPAALQAQGDGWVLTEPGEVRVDA